MRKWWALVMIAALLLGTVAVAHADGGDNWAIVSNPNPEDRLNLRAKASTDAVSLGKYYSGVAVTLLSGNVNGWYKVSIGPLTGYMDAAFLKVGAEADSVTPAMPTVTIRNAGGTGANLRAGQSTGSKSLGLYANGSQMTVFGVSEDWLHVLATDGKTGFILASLATPRIYFSGENGGQSDGSANIAVVANGDAVNRLNLRTAPTGDAPTLGKYYSGVGVTLLSGNEDGWYNVRVGNLEGYMKAEYLMIGGGVPAEGKTMPSVTVQRSTRLYKNMNSSGAVIASLKSGDVLTVMGVSTDYLHVITGSGDVGFVLADKVSPEIAFDLNSKK